MGRILASYIMPHPPLAIPEVGGGQEKAISKTIEMMKKTAVEIKGLKPDTIIVISPHAPVFRGRGCIHIFENKRLEGNFSNFRAREVRLAYENDHDLVTGIIMEADKVGIKAGGMDRLNGKNEKNAYSIDPSGKKSAEALSMAGTGELDHGTMVPLYFIDNVYKDFKLVVISIGYLDCSGFYEFGKCINRAVQLRDAENAAGGGDCVIISSGDLSHRLTREGPYGFDPAGPKFDKYFLECIEKWEVEKLVNIDEGFLDAAAQCGYYGAVMLFGALSGMSVKTEINSYEGPFGVGYAVASIQMQSRQPDHN
ncbi:MAG: hypothetical protein FWH55_07565 [Oscillospiraceae bacterium]|nr:hypothetical protein [Oscillospiraceae bacterium]